MAASHRETADTPSSVETLNRLDGSQHKHERVRNVILAYVHGQRLQPGGRLASERMLAQQLGVSHMTARRGISCLVQEGILRRVHGKGVFVAPARRVTRRKTTTIVVAYQDRYDYENSYLGLLNPAIEAALAAVGWRAELIATKTHDDAWMRGAEIANRWRAGTVQGLLLTSRYPALQVLNLSAAGIPFVWVNNSLGKELIHSVRTDREGDVLRCIRRLLAGGPAERPIHVFCRDEFPVIQRACHYAVAAGLVTAAQIHYHRLNLDRPQFETEFRQQIRGLELPAGVLVLEHPTLPQAAIEELTARQVRFPDEVSFIAGGKRPDENAPPPYTVFVGSLRELADESVKLLARVVNGEAEPGESVCVPGQIVDGGTTRPAADARRRAGN